MWHPTPAELQQYVTEQALTPLGSSLAAAIVCCVIYALFFFLALYSFIKTKYSWYDVVLISTSFRAVGMGCRAAYISHYSPGLAGTFLAFFNAGWSASGAAVWLTLGAWFKHKGVRIFSEKAEKAGRLACYLASVPIVAFGPILGVVAAGLEYGAWRTAPHAAYIGARCRRATSWGILGMFVAQLFWTLFLATRATLVTRAQKRSEAPQKVEASNANKNPLLIWILFLTVPFNIIRGCTGVVALYSDYEFVWEDDQWFYPLDVLPDFIVLCIICYPNLLARISCSWPSQGQKNGSEAADEEANGRKNNQ